MDGQNSSAASDTDQSEVLEFTCRKCPGEKFSAAELDAHRAFHKSEKTREGLRPRNNVQGEPAARPSSSTPANKGGTLRKDANAEHTRRGIAKRRSTKKHDTAIVHTKSEGG